MKPLMIFIGGQELTRYTGGKLSRKKQDMTGSFSCDIFFEYMPQRPVLVNAMAGSDITIYVGGQLAFWGTMDKRRGKSKGKHGTNKEANSYDITSSIAQDHYDVQLTARGKTAPLIDYSHRHPTGTILNTNTRRAVEEIMNGFNVELDWQSEEFDLPRVVLRDGAMAQTELLRIANENGHYCFETRDGKLRFMDRPTEFGDDIILGKNILSFSSDQSKDHSRDRVVVKGQRTSKTVWGEEAVLNVMQEAKKSGDSSRYAYTVQHYGDGSKDALERRAQFEQDKRTAQSLTVSVEMFHIQSQSGQPWDIGVQHYVEIPPEGIFNVLECTGVDYTFDAQGTLKTQVTLAPPKAAKDAADQSGKAGIGKQRRNQLGVGGDMDIWDPADLDFSPSFDATSATSLQDKDFLGGVLINTPPLTLGAK